MTKSKLTLLAETEPERIERWRAQELQRAGYEPKAAAELAARLDVDLRFAVGLIARGCPPDVAARILL